MGAVSETIVVHEVLGETVNAVSGEMARTIDSEQVDDLALNGRNYFQLVTLIPGVAVTTLDQFSNNLTATNQSINGNRTDSTNFMVDGGSNMDAGSNSTNTVPGVDFVQQVKIQTAGFSAEYGRQSGASVNVVTKAGGDRFHGSVFETGEAETALQRLRLEPGRTRLWWASEERQALLLRR